MSVSMWASVGDHGVLNTPLSSALSDVWIDRDLSWLDFNARVLAEALDERTPLLERVKFLAIFGSNLDEFFMKRMAVLREDPTPERRQLLAQILDEQERASTENLIPELSSRGIHLRRWEKLSAAQQKEADAHF